MSENNSDNMNNGSPEPDYWRSFNELYKDKDFIEASHHEFNDGVKDEFNAGTLSGLSRRKFLALLGASAALAGTGCGHRDKGEIIPYNSKPEEIMPGNPNYYASTCTACSSGCGILIKTREGRPIKVDGNLQHPVNRGKICAKGQANILNLYDPERLKAPLRREAGSFNTVEWRDADFAVLNELTKAGSKEIAVITHKIISPTAIKVMDDFIKRFPSARIYSYEFFRSSRNAAWGGEFPLIKWDQAKVIVTLEADMLGTGEDKVETVRMYSEGRNVNNLEKFNRLYAVEGNMSLTGMNADYRIRLNPLFLEEFVSLLSTNTGSVNRNSIEAFASKHNIKAEKIIHLAEDLNKYRGEAIVYAGDSLPQEIHTAVNNLNNTLGNNKLYRTDAQKVSLHPAADTQSFENLVERMNNNGVAAVIHFDSNPVYHLSPGFGYRDALRKVPLIITLTELENESSELSDYVLPIHHNYESWGDAKTRTGFYSLQQPVIWPLFKTRQKEAVLLNWAGDNPEKYDENIYYNYLTDNWRNNIYSGTGSAADFDQFWGNALHDGVVFTPAEQTQSQNFTGNGNNRTAKPEQRKYTVIFREGYTVGDGRFANNGWLQELPHPVTKITWDNYASISYRTAKELDVNNGNLIEIELNGRKQEVPVLIQPGAADNCITIELGYGRYKTGIVGTGVGFNFNTMLTKSGGFIYTTDSVKKTGGSYELASTQEHHIFDDDLTKDEVKKRNIVKEATLRKYKEDRNFMREDKDHPSVYGTHLPEMYSGVKWGMAIDMNKCIGCGECIVACNVENNIPVVGKDQVLVSREMQWLRVDRYYSGSPEDPEVLSQVMLCQHCDHAPCENVCPVVATTHSIDGLNQMAYNRCVGTRYCSNNCPYKVRRFNFFNFRDHFRDGYQDNNVISLVHNPEVTVRSRGVMEKCTFCIQRIMKAREDAIRDNRALKGTDVTTACQDACISNAITFGDMNDKNSEYYKTREHELGYYVLEELNTRPNVTYIAKLRNKEEVV
jgi:MoCo/4Fe-4S cofactor protein with predicted Tat translocation signal